MLRRFSPARFWCSDLRSSVAAVCRRGCASPWRIIRTLPRRLWNDLIDALLEKHGVSVEAVLGENGLIAQLKKRVVERALAGELTHHLGYAKVKRPKRSTTIATATARRQWLGKTEQ